MIIPKIKGNPPYSDIKKILLTSDPAMWEGLDKNGKQILEQQCEEIIDFLKGKKMRKIAIIKFHDECFSGDSYYNQCRIYDSITDWQEVDEDTYTLLEKNLEYDCKILERLPLPEQIDYYVNLAKEKEIKKEEAKKKAEEKRNKLEIKKNKIKKEEELKLLQELQTKYGKVPVPRPIYKEK